MEACCAGHQECARALIEAGANVDDRDDDNYTALMEACFRGRFECARALVDAHADLELTSQEGKSALMIACERPPLHYPVSARQGKASCAQTVLEAMAPLQDVDPLDRAAFLKLTCERFQLLELVLATQHVIEFAPAAITKANALKADTQAVIADFARCALLAAAG